MGTSSPPLLTMKTFLCITALAATASAAPQLLGHGFGHGVVGHGVGHGVAVAAPVVHAVAHPVAHAVHPVAHAVGYNDLAEVSPYTYQYGANDDSGYIAEVTYDGTAAYPDVVGVGHGVVGH